MRSFLQFRCITTVESGLSRLSHEQIINALAGSFGIEQEYTDNWGCVHPTPLDTKRNLLKALGVEVDTEAQANKAWHLRERNQRLQLTEPTIVANLSSLPTEVVFQIPSAEQRASAGLSSADLEVSLEVTDEDGQSQRLRFASADLSLRERMRFGEGEYEHWSFPFPPLQTLGYYRFLLSIRRGNQQWSQTIRVAICPQRAYIPPTLRGDGRAAGIGICLYGARSERNWGIGDFGDLKEILRWADKDLQVSMVGLNPLHAIFNRSPFNTSPYLPLSRFYRNFVYLDVPDMEDYQASREARDLVNASETQRLLAELRASHTVEYEQVAALKHKVLQQVFQSFLENHWTEGKNKTSRQKALEDYIEREGVVLDNYATFCALDAALRSREPEMWIWSQWPPEYQRPGTKAVGEFQRAHWREILFYKFVQWQLEEQLAEVQDYARSLGMCIGLYHDLALGVDRFSADFWAYQDFFIPRLRLGAPPDAFSPYGQDWGFPLPHMERLRQTGYDLFVKEIRKNCTSVGALRIDHVMRFFHLYCVPGGEVPSNGAYVSQPFEDLLKIVALESVRNKVVIIGEDLGTVPAYIRDALAKANVFSYRLLYFEKDAQQHFRLPQDYPELALVTITTHDLPTLSGFWNHADIKVREEAGLFNHQQAAINATNEREEEKEKLLAVLKELNLLTEPHDVNSSTYPEMTEALQRAVMEFLAMTPAKLFLINQGDLFREAEQQNLPGTTSEYPNWSLKMKYTVEQLRSDPEVLAFCNMFRNIVHRSGRNKPVV